MYLVNNRYRIVRNISQNTFISSFAVKDILKNNKTVSLNLINSETISIELKNKLMKEFSGIKNVDTDNILKLYNCEAVFSFDNKRVKEISKFYYTNEYFEAQGHIGDFIHKLSEEEKLKIFITVCQNLFFLHKSGMRYETLIPENILVAEDGNIIKLRDVVTIMLEQNYYRSTIHKYLYFKAPEVINESTYSVASDIYSLGVLLLCFAVKMAPEEADFDAILKSLKENEELKNTKIYSLLPVIEKMTATSAKDRYTSVYQVVEDINSILKTEFVCFIREDLEKLHPSHKMVGREFEVSSIIDIYNKLSLEQQEGKIIFLHGEAGVGKTRILNRLKHQFSFRTPEVYYSIVGQNNNYINKPLNDILKQFITDGDKELISKYENELCKFVPEITNDRKAEELDNFRGDSAKYRVMNRILKFIVESLKGKTGIFLVDDAHLSDDFAIEFIKYIIDRKSKNMLCVITCADNISKNKNINSVFEGSRDNDSVIHMKLKDLTFQETHEMIKNILLHPGLRTSVSSTIYSKTFGNPKFTEEVIKNILEEKIIYIDDEGQWFTDYNIENMPLPSSMEQVLNAQIKALSSDQINVLEIISLFKFPVPSEIIFSLLGIKAEKYSIIISSLVVKSIISENIEDFGYAYDFTNSGLKSAIYHMINSKNKKAMHKRAADSLENFFGEYNLINEEFIYQFEKCKDKERIIKYCLSNADLMNKLKNRTEEIRNIEKAISVIDKTDINKDTLYLVNRIIKLYIDEGNLSEAKKYLKIAEKYSIILKEDVILACCYNNLSMLSFTVPELGDSVDYFEKAEEIFSQNQDKIEGELLQEYIEHRTIKAKQLIKSSKYKEAEVELNEALEFCNDLSVKGRGLVLQGLGDVNLELHKPEIALSFYKQSLKYFHNCKYFTGEVISITNIGSIYANYYQEYNKAIYNYLCGKEICEVRNLLIPHILLNIHLGYVYEYILDHEKAYSYFNEALGLVEKTNRKEILYLCHSSFALAAIKLGNLKDTYKYFELLGNDIKSNTNYSTITKRHNHDAAMVMYRLGDINKAVKYIKLALKQNETATNKNVLDSRLIYQHILIHQSSSQKEKFDFKEIEEIIQAYSCKYTRIEALFDTAILLLEKNLFTMAEKYFKEAETMVFQGMQKTLEIKKLYAKGLLHKGNEKVSFFNAALKLCDSDEFKHIKWRILFHMGNCYYNENSYYAANFYYEACRTLKELLVQLPEEYIMFYSAKNNIKAPFEALAKLNGYDIKNNIENSAQLQKLLNYNGFEKFIYNEAIINRARMEYSATYSKKLNNFDDLLLNMDADDLSNLKLLSCYMGNITLATKGIIILENRHKDLSIFSNNPEDKITEDIKLVLDRVRTEKKPLLVTTMDMLMKDEVAKLCIPIISKNSLLGYIYLESTKIINAFNAESFEQCLNLVNLAVILIEKYQLMINSSIDRLTGTYTKRAMEEIIEDIIGNQETEKRKFSIVMFDLDFFKSVNDRFGHQTGDMVLKNVCSLVLESIGSSGFCGRFGGEEFVVLLPDMDKENVLYFADVIRKRVESAKILGEKVPVTISVGISVYPQQGELQNELIEKADQALYVAKEMGRNRVQLWEEKFSDKANVADKLTGILSGNVIQNHRNISVMVEIIDLIGLKVELRTKLFMFLGRIIEITEAQQGTLLLLKDDIVVEKYSRENFSDEWQENAHYNSNMVEETVHNKKGIYGIDWDRNINIDALSGLPDWTSVMVIPMIKNGVTKAVLYLSVPLRTKEFNSNEYNFIDKLAEIVTAIL